MLRRDGIDLSQTTTTCSHVYYLLRLPSARGQAALNMYNLRVCLQPSQLQQTIQSKINCTAFNILLSI